MTPRRLVVAALATALLGALLPLLRSAVPLGHTRHASTHVATSVPHPGTVDYGAAEAVLEKGLRH